MTETENPLERILKNQEKAKTYRIERINGMRFVIRLLEEGYSEEEVRELIKIRI